ncbi:universal stress protein [Lacinutrix himadriensis]|uniref:universal stress protein n=1 Tax=Lacinutrix himadriensis TaxID=641549 RepID=UPI0006E143EE|nr:universal stress protein [Lacinutrix himadriensis]
MNKNILLPTDFSDNAWSAIAYALKLYENETCTFYFLNSFKSEISRMSNLSNKLARVMKESAKKEMVELKRKARIVDANEKHSFETILSSESLLEAIHTVTTTHEIDLVVMGTKGASKTKEIFFGSNTVSVLNKIKSCPTLVVPDAYSFVTPSQIAFPTDYNKQYTDKVLSPIKALSKLYNSKIRILHIEEEKELSETQNTNINKLKKDLAAFDYSFHWMSGYDQKTSVIIDFIKELEINILVLVNNKHSFIENIINEPVIKKIGFQPIIPFLVIPE